MSETQRDEVRDLSGAADSLSGKSLAELSTMFGELKSSADAMLRAKEADAIKSAFYKLLNRLKTENASDEGQTGTFDAVEENFKVLFADYKKARSEFNRAQEALREEALAKKNKVIDELKALVDSTDNVKLSFPALRELQNRWREAGPVPATAFRDINERYQFLVEKFYDMVNIDRDLRDLDFRKNLEEKESLCSEAEKLSENEDVVAAFNELQKLHERWKELGPVAKEIRDEIWSRFKAATAVVNKKYQEYFEERKARQEENLQSKTALCERLEQIAATAVESSAQWNALTSEIESIQAKWREIGYSKDNNGIFQRFRAACDDFFKKKREYYAGVRDNMEENLRRKIEIVREAEELKLSTDWKKVTDRLISLQKSWKEIGPVPRKKSDELWNAFRAACDEFFTNRANRANRANKPGKPNKTAGVDRTNRTVHSDIRALKEKYRALQQDIATYENNIGFFSASSKADLLVQQMRSKIDDAKSELAALEKKIREVAGENK